MAISQAESPFTIWAGDTSHTLYFRMSQSGGNGVFFGGTGPGRVTGRSFYCHGIRLECDFSYDATTLANLDALDSLEAHRDIRVFAVTPWHGFDSTDSVRADWPMAWLNRRKWTTVTTDLDDSPWTPVDHIAKSGADGEHRWIVGLNRKVRMPPLRIIPGYAHGSTYPDQVVHTTAVYREMKKSFWIPVKRRIAFDRDQIDATTGNINNVVGQSVRFQQDVYVFFVGQQAYTTDEVIVPQVAYHAYWYYTDDA